MLEAGVSAFELGQCLHVRFVSFRFALKGFAWRQTAARCFTVSQSLKALSCARVWLKKKTECYALCFSHGSGAPEESTGAVKCHGHARARRECCRFSPGQPRRRHTQSSSAVLCAMFSISLLNRYSSLSGLASLSWPAPRPSPEGGSGPSWSLSTFA